MSTYALAEQSFNHVMLSGRLISELAQAHSTLRATTERSGQIVIVSAGGELDASNETTWRRLRARPPRPPTDPDPSSSTSAAWTSWPAAPMPHSVRRPSGAEVVVSKCGW